MAHDLHSEVSIAVLEEKLKSAVERIETLEQKLIDAEKEKSKALKYALITLGTGLIGIVTSIAHIIFDKMVFFR